jgi:hypothetical protein
MLFKSITLLAAIVGTTAAKKLGLLAYNVGTATLDLGGGSVSGQNGMYYKIDDGDWKEIKNEGDRAPCSVACGDNNWSPAYKIPELGDNEVFVCTDGDSCVPGNKYTCSFRYGDLVTAQIDSTEDSKFWGLGNSIGTYCGNTDVFEINL